MEKEILSGLLVHCLAFTLPLSILFAGNLHLLGTCVTFSCTLGTDYLFQNLIQQVHIGLLSFYCVREKRVSLLGY